MSGLSDILMARVGLSKPTYSHDVRRQIALLVLQVLKDKMWFDDGTEFRRRIT